MSITGVLIPLLLVNVRTDVASAVTIAITEGIPVTVSCITLIRSLSVCENYEFSVLSRFPEDDVRIVRKLCCSGERNFLHR